MEPNTNNEGQKPEEKQEQKAPEAPTVAKTEEPKNSEGTANETNKPEAPEKKMRQIIIETDGTRVRLVKAETAGTIELVAVLQSVINMFINQQ